MATSRHTPRTRSRTSDERGACASPRRRQSMRFLAQECAFCGRCGPCRARARPPSHPHRAGAKERQRRAEALQPPPRRRTRQEPRGGRRGRLPARAAAPGRAADGQAGRQERVEELAQLVVDELHETFAFYLAAIQRLDEDGVLRLIAGRGPLAEVMTEFLLTEQSASEGVNGKVARSGHTALVPDTRDDPDYIVRDPETDPRSELAVPVLVDGAVWGVLNIEATDPGALGGDRRRAGRGDRGQLRRRRPPRPAGGGPRGRFHDRAGGADEHGRGEGRLHRLPRRGRGGARRARRAAHVAVERQARDVRYAAMLHDIGKVAVPSEILLKPGPLTDEEWVTMRSHAADRRRAGRAHRRLRASRPRGARQPRALGRRRLPRRPRRRADPARRAHHRRLRHLRRDRHRPSLPSPRAPERGVRGAAPGGGHAAGPARGRRVLVELAELGLHARPRQRRRRAQPRGCTASAASRSPSPRAGAASRRRGASSAAGSCPGSASAASARSA